MKHKPDWDAIYNKAFLVLATIAVVVCVIIRTWVFMEYAGMPITEVPTWAIPWMIWW
jgi:hypothetical protein